MNWIKNNIFFLASILVLVIYSFTLAPSVTQIDSGELATVQYTLGIAHPTGYPIFTLIGYLFLNIPLGLRKITQANLLAAIWCSLAIYFFMKSLFLLMTNYNLYRKEKDKRNKKITNQVSFSDNQKILSALAGSLLLAFSKTFWMQSTSVEVYSLQTFLFSLIIYFTLRAFFSNDIKNWFYVGFVFAFGFANHMTTLLVIPFSSILFLFKEKLNSKSIKTIVKTVLFSLPILILLYLYLPVRASQNPMMNWGNPINFENFWRHFTGKQYQVWMFASFQAAKKQLVYFLNNFPEEFTFIGLMIGFIGLFYIAKTNQKIFITTLFTFLFSVFYTINYDIVDIDSYFLFTYMIFSIWIAFGFVYLYEIISSRIKIKNLILPLFVIITAIPFVSNKKNADQSDIYIFEDYTKTILNGVEKNSIILSYQWDYFISASYYFQNVENFRKDVAVIDKELLRRSWYYNQLRRNHPDVYNKIKNEAENFIEAVKPFERNENFNVNILEQNYQDVMKNLIIKNIDEGNCYLGLELVQNEMQRGEFNLPQDYSLVPFNFLFKVVRNKNYVEAPLPNFELRFPKENNKYIEFIRTTAATMLVYRASYEIHFNKIDRAKIYLEKIKEDFPEFNIPAEILNPAGM